jgi:hypothetical protein
MRFCELSFEHRVLFSVNVALVLKLEGNQLPNRFLSFLDFGEAFLQTKVNGLFQLHPHHAVGANTAFIVLALGLATLMLLILTVLLRLPSFERLSRSTAGIISLVAWLCVSKLLGIPEPLPNPPHVLLYLELIAASACAVLHLCAKWPTPNWLSLVLLAVHFGFWNWIVSGGPLLARPISSRFSLSRVRCYTRLGRGFVKIKVGKVVDFGGVAHTVLTSGQLRSLACL